MLWALRRLGRAEQLAGGHVDDLEAVRRGRAQRHLSRRVDVRAAEHEGAGDSAPAQLPGALQGLRVALPAGPEEGSVIGPKRALVGGAEQVRAEDRGAFVVEDGRLHGSLQKVLGVAAEELIQGVLAGHVHGQSTAPAPGPAPHLAQRGDGSGEGDHERRVELADVDPQLQRVGRHDRPQLAPHQPALELPSLLGGVAGPVGADQLRQLGILGLQAAFDEHAQHLDPLARLHEADHPRAAANQLGQQLGGLAEGRVAGAGVLVLEGRVPDRDPPLRGGRAVAGDQSHLLQPRQPLGELLRVGDRGRAQQEARLGPVGGGDPTQAAQHVGDVGAEHAAVDVGLVDHHDREVGEQLRPGGVVGQDADVEHVRVAEHHVGRAADLPASLARRIPVVDRAAQLAQPERVERAGLVLGQRLGRDTGTAPAPGDRGRGPPAWAG